MGMGMVPPPYPPTQGPPPMEGQQGAPAPGSHTFPTQQPQNGWPNSHSRSGYN
jgi:hypothetical protein